MFSADNGLEMSNAKKTKKNVIQMGQQDAPFEPTRFSFDPKQYSIYHNPAEKRAPRPGDQFIQNDIRKRSVEALIKRNAFVATYRHFKYSNSFRWKAFGIFLLLALPGLLFATLYVLGVF